jgi:hypothetical protein
MVSTSLSSSPVQSPSTTSMQRVLKPVNLTSDAEIAYYFVYVVTQTENLSKLSKILSELVLVYWRAYFQKLVEKNGNLLHAHKAQSKLKSLLLLQVATKFGLSIEEASIAYLEHTCKPDPYLKWWERANNSLMFPLWIRIIAKVYMLIRFPKVTLHKLLPLMFSLPEKY